MAESNDITGNRWTFMAVTDDAEEEALQGMHTIIAMFWTECSMAGSDIAADDELLIHDGNGKIIYNRVAAGTPATAPNDMQIVIGYPGLQVDGFKLSKKDGGMLIVWLAIPYT